MLMEQRKGFQGAVALLAALLVALLYWHLHQALPADAAMAQIALVFLSAGAVAGFSRLFTLLLPPLLAKVFPALDGKSEA